MIQKGGNFVRLDTLTEFRECPCPYHDRWSWARMHIQLSGIPTQLGAKGSGGTCTKQHRWDNMKISHLFCMGAS